MSTHILLIDNYDSFTFNLQHLLLEIPNVTLTIRRNDEPFLEELEAGKYAGVVISPGPGSAEDKNYFGFNNKVILNFGTEGLPILG
ncbi:MAG: anthranilate/aminodeoxychorismate synthase component II, partial [Proteobacteria bacterium]|nr:anthranilate/aminodeoxychorismate synthase component II [Pseudomonadota bacterium]